MSIPARPLPRVPVADECDDVETKGAKRAREEVGEQPEESAQKKGKMPDDVDVAAPQPIAPADDDQPNPPALVQEIKLSPYITYPNVYKDGFEDGAKFMSFADPQPSHEGGQIMFINYVYQSQDAATGAIRTASKPFLWNTPNGMHLPTGIKTWPDGKTSALLSSGQDWESNQLMVAQHTSFETIRRRCIEAVIEKQWNSPQPNTYEAIEEYFTPIMFIGVDEKTGKPHPPSIKASIITTSKNRTEIFEFAPSPPLRPMMPGEVTPGSQGTAVLHLAWIYRKKDGKKWKYSVRINMFQLVAEVPSAGNASKMGSRNTCSVFF